MLQCTKVGWKITCLSLGEFLGPMQEMAMKFKHLGIVAWLVTLRNLVFKITVNSKLAWKSWNLGWCHFMAPTCCGKKIGRIGTSFDISFLQIGASLMKACGFERENVTFCAKRHTLPPRSWFFYRANIELYECRVKNWNYSGFVWPFLYINWVSGHLMCIIQIWTTSTCSRAPKLVEKSHVCPRVNF